MIGTLKFLEEMQVSKLVVWVDRARPPDNGTSNRGFGGKGSFQA